MLTPAQTSAYLARINHPAPLAPTLTTLRTLQAAHMRAVPFENLDVLLARPLALDVPALFDKIVTRRRGGYCFELNTLFAALLRALGFSPVPVMARVWLRDPVDTPPRTHLLHRVHLDGTHWLTDVGFGGSASHVPLPMPTAHPASDPDGELRVLPDPEFGYRVSRRLSGESAWQDQFTVEPASAPASDILLGNHFTETHPSSHFRAGIGVGLFGTSGRTGFYSATLTRRTPAGTVREDVRGLDHTLATLAREFGLTLDLSPSERETLSNFC